MNTVFRSKKTRLQTLENVGKLPNLQALSFSTVTETLRSPSKGSYSSCLKMMHLHIWNLERVNSRTRVMTRLGECLLYKDPQHEEQLNVPRFPALGQQGPENPWGSLASLCSHTGELDPQWGTYLRKRKWSRRTTSRCRPLSHPDTYIHKRAYLIICKTLQHPLPIFAFLIFAWIYLILFVIYYAKFHVNNKRLSIKQDMISVLLNFMV